jgi:hypothetical protein
MVLIPCCHRAQELKLKSYVERGMLGRLIQARVYFHKADNVLQNIEVVSVVPLQVGEVADVIL